LLVTLAVALSAVVGVPVLAQPSFTGDVEADFTGSGVLTFPDPDGQNVFVPGHPSAPISSGWDIKDVRVTYDSATDVLYVGLNSYQTVGDADTDGNEGLMTYDSGTDVPNLGSGESVSVYFDLNQDGNWDVIAGVPSDTDFSGFTVKNATGSTPGMAFFGANLTTGYDHLGIRYWTPSSAPDLEFEIWNFSHLPNQDGELSAFTIGAFMGSVADVNITEDWLLGSTGPAAINIVKKTNGTDNNAPTGPHIAVGDTVTWTYNVTNPGSENLTNVVVTDDNGTPGNLADDWSPTYIGGDDGDNILETTEAWLYEANSTATAGQYGNNATVTGDFDGFTISDADPDHYFGSAPCIHIEKSTNGQDADLAPGPYVEVGGALLWEYVVTNCGSVNLTSIVVTDDNGTPGNLGDDWNPAYVSGDNGDNILQTTETWIYQAASTAAAGQYANNSTVTGTPPVGSNVSDDDPSHYFGSTPCIHIEKSTNGQDADSPTGPYIPVGDPVTWVYNVTNCGNVPLSNIIVTDSEVGVTPAYVSGDGGDLVLQTTETWIYQAVGTAALGQYANTGYVTGTPPVASSVSDDDPSHYFGSAACIHIEKSTNGQDADSPSGPYVDVGGAVLWQYVVTNCGSVNLTDIIVTDDNGTPGNPLDDWSPVYISGDDGDLVLETTETWIYQAAGTAAAGQYANNATVVGYYDVVEVTDWDPSHYFNRLPVGWETYPVNKVRVLLPWIALLAAIIVGASLLVLRHRRAQS